jgi:hypothetical protein
MLNNYLSENFNFFDALVRNAVVNDRRGGDLAVTLPVGTERRRSKVVLSSLLPFVSVSSL